MFLIKNLFTLCMFYLIKNDSIKTSQVSITSRAYAKVIFDFKRCTYVCEWNFPDFRRNQLQLLRITWCNSIGAQRPVLELNFIIRIATISTTNTILLHQLWKISTLLQAILSFSKQVPTNGTLELPGFRVTDLIVTAPFACYVSVLWSVGKAQLSGIMQLYRFTLLLWQ